MHNPLSPEEKCVPIADTMASPLRVLDGSKQPIAVRRRLRHWILQSAAVLCFSFGAYWYGRYQVLEQASVQNLIAAIEEAKQKVDSNAMQRIAGTEKEVEGLKSEVKSLKESMQRLNDVITPLTHQVRRLNENLEKR